MLVLTRKVGEAIAIGEDVKIIVMQIKGKQVRLGIKASPTTMVHREEVYERIQEENRRASLAVVGDMSEVTDILRSGVPGDQDPSPVAKRKQVKISS